MVARLRRRLEALLGRSRFEHEMAEELRQHLELEVEDRIRSGMSPGEARRTARRDFGAVERWKEEARAARGLAGWDGVRQDVGYAWRALRSAPGFTGIAVLTLALGIGATAAVFSVVDGLLLRPLAYDRSDRVVRLLEFREDGGGRGTISEANYHDWVERSTAFESASLYDEYHPTLRLGDRALKVEAASVEASYFDVLGVRPAVGRFFLPAENDPGSNRVVLSWGLWRELWGGDPGVVGATVDLTGTPYTVVGVAPRMEDPGLSGVGQEPRLWRSPPEYFFTNGRGGRSFTAVARLAPGVSVAAAQAELSAIHAVLEDEYPEANSGRRVRVEPLKANLVGDVRPALWVLFGSVTLVLLIACANVANLLLFRAAGRAREVGVRTALGASRGRIVRQLMVESSALAVLGAVGGMAVAAVAVRGLVTLAAGQLPRLGSVGLDLRVLAFATLAASVSTVLVGLVPALRTTDVDVSGVLKEGGRGTTGSGRQGRLRATLVAAEVALAVVVMLTAGLLVRSLLQLQAVDPGMAAERALVLRIDPPADPYSPFSDDGHRALLGLYERARSRVAAVAGVEAVGLTDLLPMSGSFNGNAFRVEGRPEPPPGEVPGAETRAVTPGYMEALGIPTLEGRGIAATDGDSARRIVVVSEAFVRAYFPAGDAVGSALRIFGQDRPPARIVGVVGDVAQFGLDRVADPVIYVPIPQAPAWMTTEPWVVVRTAADPVRLAPSVRSALEELVPGMPVYAVQPMSDVIGTTLARPRFRTLVLAAFASLAFLLAAVGVYGMVAYTAARRLPEIGIRMAMGADRRRIVRLIVGSGMRPVVLGALVGLVVGLAAVRLLTGFLFGVATTDPVTFAAVPLSLALIAGLASWIPARRAAALAPLEVLRAE